MAKKVKPYENSNRNRTLPNQSNNKKNTNTNKNKNTKDKKKDLEKTAKFKFDVDFLNDEKTLDTSFLEGRIQGKNNKKGRDKVLKEKQVKARSLDFLKSLFFLLSFLCIIILITVILWNQSHMTPSGENDKDVVEEELAEIDDNYLFVGDFHMRDLPMDDFSYPYVIVGDEGMTTESIANDFHQKIYIYNPSVVMIQVGLEDLANETRIEDIKERYSSILKQIKEMRPNAKVYVISVYPINPNKVDEDSRYFNMNNATIIELNKEIKNLAKTYDDTYIDCYASLSENNLLKEQYSIDGIHLNKLGYKAVWKTINRFMEEKK